ARANAERATPDEDQGEERRHAEEHRPLLEGQRRGTDDGKQPGVGERQGRADADSARRGPLIAEISSREILADRGGPPHNPPATRGPVGVTGPSCYSGNAPSNFVPSPIAIA